MVLMALGRQEIRQVHPEDPRVVARWGPVHRQDVLGVVVGDEAVIRQAGSVPAETRMAVGVPTVGLMVKLTDCVAVHPLALVIVIIPK